MAIDNNSSEFLKPFHLSAAPVPTEECRPLGFGPQGTRDKELSMPFRKWRSPPSWSRTSTNNTSTKAIWKLSLPKCWSSSKTIQNIWRLKTIKMHPSSISMSQAKMLHYPDLPTTSTWDFAKTRSLEQGKEGKPTTNGWRREHVSLCFLTDQ